MTNEIDDAEIDAAVRLMERIVVAAGEVVYYDWDESGSLVPVTPVNPQKEAT
jgi:hypothetical protein